MDRLNESINKWDCTCNMDTFWRGSHIKQSIHWKWNAYSKLQYQSLKRCWKLTSFLHNKPSGFWKFFFLKKKPIFTHRQFLKIEYLKKKKKENFFYLPKRGAAKKNFRNAALTNAIHSDSSKQRWKLMLGSMVEELGTHAFISFLKLFFTCRTSHTSMGTTSHCWKESCFPP